MPTKRRGERPATVRGEDGRVYTRADLAAAETGYSPSTVRNLRERMGVRSLLHRNVVYVRVEDVKDYARRSAHDAHRSRVAAWLAAHPDARFRSSEEAERRLAKDGVVVPRWAIVDRIGRLKRWLPSKTDQVLEWLEAETTRRLLNWHVGRAEAERAFGCKVSQSIYFAATARFDQKHGKPTPGHEGWISIDETMRRLGAHGRTTIWYLAKKGYLTMRMAGKRCFVLEASVEALITRRGQTYAARMRAFVEAHPELLEGGRPLAPIARANGWRPGTFKSVVSAMRRRAARGGGENAGAKKGLSESGEEERQ